MDADDPLFPSDFYRLMEGATEVVLQYPSDGDAGGPIWNDQGQLDLERVGDWEEEDVGIVALGGNRYRLTERLAGPFSCLTLYWGDEFTAEELEDGILRITSVIVPRRFAHFRFLTSGPHFSNDHPLAKHLHALGGAWETVAGGMLTITLPAENSKELQRLMYEEGLAPGVLPLVT